MMTVAAPNRYDAALQLLRGVAPTSAETPESAVVPELDVVPPAPMIDMAAVAGHAPFRPRNPAGTRVAAILSSGGERMQVADMLTGYGRAEGYDSLANARRAAYMLTRGENRSASGIYQQGSRFYVRALGAFEPDSGTALSLLHIEGAPTGRLGLAIDPRLAMIVDGATKLFARDVA